MCAINCAATGPCVCLIIAERCARRQTFAVTGNLNRQRTNFVTAQNRLRQRFPFQQRADQPDRKAIARADGIHYVLHVNRRNLALFARGGFIPRRRRCRF